MRDNELPVVDGSPESIAYQLMLHVMEIEGRPLTGAKVSGAKISRNVILDAYADCLEAVRGSRQRRAMRIASSNP